MLVLHGDDVCFGVIEQVRVAGCAISILILPSVVTHYVARNLRPSPLSPLTLLFVTHCDRWHATPSPPPFFFILPLSYRCTPLRGTQLSPPPPPPPPRGYYC